MAEATSFRLAVDIGGTFTDAVLLGADGRLSIAKLPTTDPDFADAAIATVESLVASRGLGHGDCTTLLHATTVTTNAVLGQSGTRVGLLTTAGFRDVLELRRVRFPDTYNLFWEKPPPLISRRLRCEVNERMGADGAVVEALDLDHARGVVETLVRAHRVEALAVCLLNAYVNPVHEQQLRDLVLERFPELSVSISSDVLPEIREYERTSTTALNAYLSPVVAEYLEQLEAGLDRAGITAPLEIMRSDGGTMNPTAARRRPVHMLESGPAAGVVGAASLARELEIDRALTLDMGGTTAKACLIEDGEPLITAEYEIGAPITVASRLLKGGGYTVRIPALDLAEVSAGGGSLVRVDAGGGLHVGPDSAGSTPGPVCFGRGGTTATVTDANLVLGYLNPQLAGGHLVLDVDAAREAIADVARRADLTVSAAALGITQIANAVMGRALRSVSTARGRDIRNATLITFGGGGPLHAAPVARSLGMSRVVVPRFPGVFSAVGLLHARRQSTKVMTLRAGLSTVEPDAIAAAVSELERRATAEAGEEGGEPGALSVQWFADLHYRGQWHEITVAVDERVLQPGGIEHLAERFVEEYTTAFGYALEDHPIELIGLRVVAQVDEPGPGWPRLDEPGEEARSRLADFGDGLVDTPVLTRPLLRSPVEGPAIVEEFDSTVLVPPRATARLDALDNIVIDLEVDA